MSTNSNKSKARPKMIPPKVQIFKRAKPSPKKITKLLRNLKGSN